MTKKHYENFFTARTLFIFVLFMLVLCSTAMAETATIAWDPNPEPDIYGYKVFYGTESRNYTDHVDVNSPTQTQVEITGLLAGNTYYFAVKAVDLAGQESDFSDEVSRTYELPNVVPEAGLTASPESGIAPIEVVFSSTSTDSDGNIVSTEWNFGDGATASGTSAVHTYTSAGTYTVTLTVTDDDGAIAQVSRQINVAENQVPVASIDMDNTSGFAPVSIEFSAAGSSDSDGSITQYAWNFGDGTTTTGETAAHTYETPGTYTVTLTVTDDKGADDSETAQIEVKQGYTYTWVLGENSASDLTGTCDDTYININTENYADSDSLRTYTWPTDEAANAIIMKWNLSALPQDAEIQSATLELYLKEARGDDPYEISAHRIVGVDPIIDACTGETFDGTSPWTNNTSLAQDNIAPAVSVTVIDTAAGFKAWDITGIAQAWIEIPGENHGVLLNADTTAASDSFRYFASSQAADKAVRPRLTITFITEQQPDLPPRAEAAADTLSGKAPLTVNFSAEGSHDAENSLTYSWNFDDGSDTAEGITAAHQYIQAGTFHAVLTVTDGAGQTDTAELTIEVVENQAPVASAQADVTSGYAPLTVLFDAGNSTDSDGNIAAWSWDFNSDGVEDAEGVSVEHTFTEAGEYNVTLTVTDDSGATAQDTSVTISVTRNAAPEITGFSATPDALNNPGMQASFNADVTDPEGEAVTVHIDFGNGQSATQLPAECTYAQTGTYNVTLTAEDEDGNQSTATITVQVTDKTPAKPYNIVLTAN